jgi:hypothetical protein
MTVFEVKKWVILNEVKDPEPPARCNLEASAKIHFRFVSALAP